MAISPRAPLSFQYPETAKALADKPVGYRLFYISLTRLSRRAVFLQVEERMLLFLRL